MKNSSKPSLTQPAVQVFGDAGAKLLEDHRRRAKPLAVWRDGKAVSVPVPD